MSGARDYHTKRSQSEKEVSLICGTWKKKDEKELIYKTSSETLETNVWLPEGKRGGRDKLGVWDYHLRTTM